jgi:hypothetical protein
MDIRAKFNNPNLKKIVNVYNNNVVYGFGDYLRGCYCFYQICMLLNLQFDMDISNHSIYKFTINNHSDSYAMPIVIFGNNNFGVENQNKFIPDVIRLLNSSKYTTLCISSNAIPIFPTLHYSRNFIQTKISPNDEMMNNINIRLNKLQISKNNYKVIHIRSGDTFMIKNDIQNHNTYIQQIITQIKQIMDDTSVYVLISDNNKLKMILQSNIPKLQMKLTKYHTQETNQI